MISELIPVNTDFRDENGNDRMKEMIQENYNRIKAEVKQIVADELSAYRMTRHWRICCR